MVRYPRRPYVFDVHVYVQLARLRLGSFIRCAQQSRNVLSSARVPLLMPPALPSPFPAIFDRVSDVTACPHCMQRSGVRSLGPVPTPAFDQD